MSILTPRGQYFSNISVSQMPSYVHCQVVAGRTVFRYETIVTFVRYLHTVYVKRTVQIQNEPCVLEMRPYSRVE